MRKLTIFTLLLCILFTAACKKILEPLPEGQAEVDALFSSESALITAATGAYTPLYSIYQRAFQEIDRASDDGFTWRKEVETDFYTVDAGSATLQEIWSNLYGGIGRSNVLLGHLDAVETYTGNTKKELEGQAKFLRALYYFNLVRLYGKVPLILIEVSTRADAEQPRAPITDVYAQIKADLTDAIALLPESYPDTRGHEKGRATKWAALALKAKVHLELREWNEVVAATDGLIGKGALLPNFANNFNGSSENGPGSLFEVQYGGTDASTTSSIGTSLSPVVTPFNGGATTLPTDEALEGTGGGLSSGNAIVQEFESGDKRFEVTFSTYNLEHLLDPDKPKGTLNYINKFYNPSDPLSKSTWNFTVIRYADVLLMRAEAINEIAYSPNSEAFTLINQIRDVAGLAHRNATTASNQQELRQQIRHERRMELAFECNRYFDLNRWGILESTIQFQMDYRNFGEKFPSAQMISHEITGQPYHLYPIPFIELANNAKIESQNPGY